MDIKEIKMWEPIESPFDTGTLNQIYGIASLPCVDRLAIMPDSHVGRGCVIGSVIATKSAVLPSAVGVDIGCGMLAVQLSLTASDLPDSLKDIRHDLERTVPLGFNTHSRVPGSVTNAWDTKLEADFADVIAKAPKVGRKGSELTQLGTLGGGNHFIELCLDENSNVWLVLHSGSRGVGNRIGQYYIEQAYKDCEKNGIKVSKETGWLTENTDLFANYLQAVEWAQKYAMINRELMKSRILDSLKHIKGLPSFSMVGQTVQCHHNYIAKEVHFGEEYIVTRKGAVRAGVGEMGIIPGSMGAKTYIVEGRGNVDSLMSCSHGAGRLHSRSKAKELFSIDSLKETTKGVECRKDIGVIDEHPAAYKDLDHVMNAQADLVEKKHQLKQVLCLKG